MHAAAWAAAYAPLFEPDPAVRAVDARRGRWHQRIAAGDGPVLLAEADGRPVALSCCLPAPGRSGVTEVYAFYAHPDTWGTGVAGALMAETLRGLREDEYGDVVLWTLRRTAQSRRFYDEQGFTESGAQRTYDFSDGQPLEQLEYQCAL